MVRISEKKRLQMEEMKKHRPADWINKNGAPTKEKKIHEYMDEHPGASMGEIMRGTNSARATVRKWMKTYQIISLNL